jgi:hypothetical protein
MNCRKYAVQASTSCILGMESGADSVLKMVNKGVTAKEPITAGIRSFKHIRVVFEPITPGMV